MQVTSAGQFNCSGTSPLICVLPAGRAIGTYTLTYTALVLPSAVGTVTNTVVGTGGDNPTCVTADGCRTTTRVADPAVRYSKTASPSGAVSVGDLITYTLTAEVINSQTIVAVPLTDTMGPGLAFVSVTNPGIFNCGTGNPLTCTLPSGTVPGTYSLTYQARVTPEATGKVRNNVVSTGSNTSCSGICQTENDVRAPRVTYNKRVNGNSPAASVGDTLSYTLRVVVENSRTTAVVTLTDTMGPGLTFSQVTDAGVFTCNAANPLECTLPAGTVPGEYTLTYEASVNPSASGQVRNAVVGTGGDNPLCVGACTTETTVLAPAVNYSKSVNAPATQREVGDILTYTLTARVSNSRTTADLTLTDTLGTGLDFVAVTDAGIFTCNAANPLVCVLPAQTVPGTYRLTYTARVNSEASGDVRNVVVGGGGDNPTCVGSCETITPIQDPEVGYSKTVSGPAQAAVGDVLTYTLNVAVTKSQTTDIVRLTDTLGAGLDFVAVTNAGAFTCNATNPLVCTLPAGTVPGNYALTYTARVNTQATGNLRNAVVGTGGDNPSCSGVCTTDTPLRPSAVVYRKAAVNRPASVKVGDEVQFELRVSVQYSQTSDAVTLIDNPGVGYELVSFDNVGIFNCSGTNPLTCVLPRGTLPGQYDVLYTLRVTPEAVGRVTNAVVGSGGDNPTCTGICTIEIPLSDPSVTYTKSANTAGPVKVGDTITYTLTAEVTNSQLTQVFTLTDTLGTGLDFGAVTSAGAFTCNATNPLVCTLPAGTVPGTYALSYTATVNAQATANVRNAVVGTGENPVCTVNCDVVVPVLDPRIALNKTIDLAANAVARVGDVLTYTVTATVTNSQLTQVFTLTDTLGAGLDFGSVVNAGAFTCNAANPLVCTLPANTPPGQYAVVYTAVVNATAANTVKNAVVGTGGDEIVCEGSCEVITPIVDPTIKLVKTSNPPAGTEVKVGQTIDYTVTATVEGAALSAPLTLIDTPSQGLTITSTPNGCTMNGRELSCVLPAGTTVGSYSFTYQAVVGADADGRVRNQIRGETPAGNKPECVTCEVEHKVEDPLIRLTKVAGVKTVKVGDLVRYTLTIENLSGPNLVNATVIDTPAAGFTYVEGSLVVADADNFGSVTGTGPIRIGGIDVASGERATVSYLMRVGAGVRQGTHINTAIVTDKDGKDISNPATAEVSMDGDPVFDDSLIFGTVFDDRDGDGWQDAASMSGIKVQGGFAPEVYVAGSTTMDRGAGPAPVADASSPMLHGIQIGDLAGRQSEATAPATVVIRQRLTAPTFTDDFVLTNRQGVTVRMDAAGNTSVEKSGDAARGLNGADPQVERRMTRDGDGYVVDYIIRNMGIDERGIPGVRIGTVEGLIIETDQFGRFHLTDIQGGDTGRGRNFIMKVDPASLPHGAEFTTENPLVRRITPGVPVRFDWGVRFPSAVIPGGRQLIELELGQVAFAPGAANVAPEHEGLLDQMAERVREYRGGEIVIVANGESEGLALARAQGVKAALEAKLAPSERTNLTVAVRTEVRAPNLVSLSGERVRLGTVLFDTDKADIRPEHKGLLDTIADQLKGNLHREVTIVGGADVRGASAYNAELGMRRAQAVSRALSERLPANTNVRVTVEDVGLPASSGPAAGR
ncbi:isopeptide-forming domain-containing fimbrial protein [Brevundimonas sp. UBA5866]|uniref:isopeptide-forming domain-containing fimbrial protein n=1 Tax=Brevundimonas sp. UBA5866 TaxID=1946132 RepID=UPI0025C27507|nr:isopeptide-forming domain-containing fimbrial protein [Brevundimonas sp. UBA5866]